MSIKDKIKARLKKMKSDIKHGYELGKALGEKEAQPKVVPPQPEKLKLVGGYTANQYIVPQIHLPSMIHALREGGFAEVTSIENKNVEYVVGTENYWLTVSGSTKSFNLSPRCWPPMGVGHFLPTPDVPEA